MITMNGNHLHLVSMLRGQTKGLEMHLHLKYWYVILSLLFSLPIQFTIKITLTYGYMIMKAHRYHKTAQTVR